MRLLFVFCIICLSFINTSSAFTIRGVITDIKGEKLSYTNIHVQGTTISTSANTEGQYLFELPAGKYALVFQHVGFKQFVRQVDLQKDMELDVMLEVAQYEIKDVLINGNEDPAIAVIRKAIEKRKYFLSAVESYSCDAYVKGMQRLLNAPSWAEKRLKGAGIVIGKNGVVYLSESQSRLYYKKPNKFHEVIYSSKMSGSARGFTFNSAQNFFFNFYERDISIPIIAQRPFISPLSENAFFYYNFHMLGAYKEGDYLVNKIQVTPKRKNDLCFTGTLSIVENNWNIHSLELFLTKKNGIEYLDTLKVTQYFLPVKNDLWLPTQQRYDAAGGFLGIKGDGYFLGIFKNYIVNDLTAMPVSPPKIDSSQSPKKIAQQKKKFEKKVEKKVFTSEIVKIEKEANKRSDVYWDSIRPMPLTELEAADYALKDSIEKIKETEEFKDSTDKLLNRPNIFSVLTGYTFSKQNRKMQIEFPALVNIVNFNTVEGVNFHLKFAVRKTFDKQRRISFEPIFRYGLSNRQFNAMGKLSFRNSQLHDEWITLSGGKFISQFNELQPQPEFGNTFQTLLFGNNYMKLYQQYFIKMSYSREVYNGIDASLSVNYMVRSPLENTYNYTFLKKFRNNLSPNGMDLPGLSYDNDNISPHSNFRIDLKFHFIFGQQYISRPDMRLRVTSPYPELLVIYKRAIGIKNFSDLDYDFLEAQLYGVIPMKIIGTMNYRFGGGGFPSRKNIDFADYKHFYGNFLTQGGTDLLGFHLLRYYRHSTNLYFAEAHIEHHFGGFLFNKIPGIRTLKLDEVIGVHFLYTPVRKQYLQVNAGFANIFKVLRVDFVAGFGSDKNERYYGARMALALSIFR